MALNGKKEQEAPITQIIYLEIPNDTKLRDDGGTWSDVLSALQDSPGFQRLYWGRSLERPDLVQVHVVRDTLSCHQECQSGPTQKVFESHMRRLTDKSPRYRHAQLNSWDAKNSASAYDAPYTGTAIYLNTTKAWHEGAWPLWTFVVREIDGCLGGTGGRLLEPVETIRGPINSKGETETVQECSIVFVGWETTKKHEDYHHTTHFADHYVILTCGNDGFAEYGHICFEGSKGPRVATDPQAKL